MPVWATSGPTTSSGASTRVIAQALELEPQVARFVADTQGASATEFDRRWRDLVLAVHRLV